MNIFGLDIGSTSIKMAQLEKSGKQFRLVAAGLAATPLPGLNTTTNDDFVTVASALKKLHQEAKLTTKKVVLSLPEAEIFTRIIEMPPMSESELVQAIPWEAEQYIPRPLSEVSLDWRVISKGETGKEMGRMKIFLVAAPNALIEKYMKLMKLAGFEVVAAETEMIAAARALVTTDAPPTMILDLGAKTTDLGIVSKGQVVFTRSTPTAGEALTRAIASSLALEVGQAEEYKRAYGLEAQQLEGKIKEALTPVFGLMLTEIKRALQSWREKEKEPLTRVVLAGGTANLPQASAIMTSELGVEVQLADPFVQLSLGSQVSTALRGNSCLFATAVGLAQKEGF